MPESVQEQKRPLIHFTAKTGWINDPNGMIYHDGIYHMYFQHNPYGAKWGNMHWGHAYSLDLYHWNQQEDVLFPDENGTMFSGCAFADTQNAAGFGTDAILYYYTAAAVHNEWAGDKGTTQRFAYSIDRGTTLQKSDRFILEHIVDENRDPKVFYHKDSNAYIMALYLTKNDFAIYRSSNLLDWEQTQVLTLPKAWECPDLFPLALDGNPEEIRWIFWSADGFYFVGDFDGYCFTPKSDRQMAYATKLPYAAQTYAGLGNRIISQSWLRTQNHGNYHTGLMALPVELSLTMTDDGERIRLLPAKELEAFRKEEQLLKSPIGWLTELNENAMELICQFEENQSGKATLRLLEQDLNINFATGTVQFKEESFCFDNRESLELRIYLDYDVVEIFAQQGSIYFPCENDIESLTGNIEISCKDVTLNQAILYPLDSNRSEKTERE